MAKKRREAPSDEAARASRSEGRKKHVYFFGNGKADGNRT